MRTILLLTLMFVSSGATAAARQRWQLEAVPTAVGTVTAPGASGPGNYLYLSLKVANHTGRSVSLRLALTVATEVPGRRYRGGYDPLIHRHLEEHVFGREMKTLSASRGPLADGDEIEILVTFGKIDPLVGRFDISIDGLADRVYQDKHKWWVEDRILSLSYVRGGDDLERHLDRLVLRSARWREAAPRRELPRK